MSNRLKLLREKASRPSRPVEVLLDGEIRGQIEAVEDELDRLDKAEPTDRRLTTKSSAAQRRQVEAEAERLRKAAADATVTLVVQGMQRTPYRQLINAHPPRTGPDGKTLLPADLIGVNTETVQVPLIRACVIGHKENPDAPVEPLPDGYLDWLLGTETEDPFLTDRQIEVLYQASLVVCRGDEAVPLPRKRSATETSDAG